MRELIDALEDLRVTLRNMQDYLRAESWPSREVTHAANDVIVSLGMVHWSVERLKALLEPLEITPEEAEKGYKEGEWTQEQVEAKLDEIAQPTQEEEKGGEDIGEQVSEPEGGEAGPEIPPQEPEAGAPKGHKRVRKREE